jgi:hypothetical protein
MMDQWETIDIRQFRSTWVISPQTAVRWMAMLKPFFEYCVSNKQMDTKQPGSKRQQPEGQGDVEPWGFRRS